MTTGRGPSAGRRSATGRLLMRASWRMGCAPTITTFLSPRSTVSAHEQQARSQEPAGRQPPAGSRMLQFSDSERANLQGKSHTFDQPVTASCRESIKADANQTEVYYRLRGQGHSNLVGCGLPRDVRIANVHLASEPGGSNGDQGFRL